MSFPLSSQGLLLIAKGPGGTFAQRIVYNAIFPFPHGSLTCFSVIDPGALPGRGFSLIRALHPERVVLPEAWINNLIPV
jgi:hypothetical protein